MPGTDLKYILAIDLGTSGSKTALISTRGEVVDFDFEKVPLRLFPDGGAEQNAEDWWNAILATSKRLLQKGHVPAEDIVAVNCSTQWAGTVAVDENGDPLMNAIIWMDSRGAEYTQKLVKGLISVAGYDLFKVLRWIRMTGGAPALSGKDPIGHILYIRNTYPEIYKKTYKFLEPKDFINQRLTGIMASSAETIICHWVTDNRDISNITYNDKLIKDMSLTRSLLPDIRPTNTILGPLKPEVATELGLKQDVQVITGSPDVQAAAIGSGAVQNYEGHIYIGTSSWISAHVPFKKSDISHMIATVPSGIPGRYLIVDEQETAGGAFAFLKDNILYNRDALFDKEPAADIFDVLCGMADGVPAGSNGVIFTPWLNGERTPVENNSLRACFYNMSLKSNRADMVRSVLEGVAFNGRWMLKYIEKFMGRPMEYIHMVGGGAKSDTWCQIHADIMDRPIKQVEDGIQANARGSAFQAAVALGYLTFEDIPGCIKIKQTYQPDPHNRKVYDDIFKEYLNIYKHNKGIFQRLNKGH